MSELTSFLNYDKFQCIRNICANINSGPIGLLSQQQQPKTKKYKGKKTEEGGKKRR